MGNVLAVLAWRTKSQRSVSECKLMESRDSEESTGGPRIAPRERRALLQALAMKNISVDSTACGADKPSSDADAAHSQDFLYDELGLPAGEGDFSLTDVIPALAKR